MVMRLLWLGLLTALSKSIGEKQKRPTPSATDQMACLKLMLFKTRLSPPNLQALYYKCL